MKYFDKTFWKMSLGFVALIMASLVILVSIKIYESQAAAQSGGDSVQSANNIARSTK